MENYLYIDVHGSVYVVPESLGREYMAAKAYASSLADEIMTECEVAK